MEKITLTPIATRIARLAVSATFLVAAVPKLQDPSAFASAVAAFRVLPPELSAWVALLLPWLELITAIGLLLPAIRRMSGYIIATLLAAFIALHSSAWARGLDISCGCFGSETAEPTSDYQWLILRNLALLAALLFVIAQDRKLARLSAPE